MKIRFCAISMCLALTFCLSLVGKSSALEYPKTTIQITLPAKAGGDTDLYGRVMAKYLEKYLGQPCVVVNVVGSGGSIGSQQVMESKPDGHTIFFGVASNVLLNHMMGIVDYKYDKFDIIGIPLMDKSNMMAGSSKWAGKTFADIVGDIRENPEEYVFGTEVGSLGLLAPLALQRSADIEFNLVDSGTMAERITNLLGGQIDFFFGPYGSLQGYLKSGDMVALALFSDERHAQMPNVPTFEELGYKNAAFLKGFFMAVAPGTDPAILEKLRETVAAICKDKDFAKEMANYFIVPEYLDVEKTLRFMEESEAQFSQFKDEFAG